MITQENLQLFQRLPLIQNYTSTIHFLQNLAIFNNDFFELQRINHLGKDVDLIQARIVAATSYLELIKNQQVMKNKSKSIKEIKNALVPMPTLTIDDDFEVPGEEEFNKAPTHKRLYRRFDDSQMLLEDAFPYPEIRPAQARILNLFGTFRCSIIYLSSIF